MKYNQKRFKAIAILLVAVILISFFFIPATAQAASVTGAGVVSVSSGSLNVRSSASASSTIVSTLPKGSYVTLLDHTGSWWHVKYGANSYGYCSDSYITKVSSTSVAAVKVSSGSLNVRSGAGTGYSIVGTLANGATVVVLSVSGSWDRILYNGTRTGYVSNAYLGSGSVSGYTAVSLSLQNFKQTDSRWANTAIGSAGTIKTIGCLTTALAMTESYRLGTVIYPNAMVSRLSYTSGGAAYWPSVYQFYTNSDYLAKVYQLLKSNKPVIVGSKTSSGGSHYVVVTGFKGGALTASNFTINDPGFSTRHTLDQQFSAYPIFYKLAYYA